MSAARLSQQFRDIANKVDQLATNYTGSDGEVLDYIFDDDDLETGLEKLWDMIPSRWRDRLQPKPNRLYSQLRRNYKGKSLDKFTEETVWNWALTPELFYKYGSTETVQHNSKLFDTIFSSLIRVEELVDQRFKEISDTNILAQSLIQHGLISNKIGDMAKGRLNTWILAGRKYKSLADALGGRGALIYLPDYSHSLYETLFHINGKHGLAIIQLLGNYVPKAAGEKRIYDFNAHDVADKIYSKFACSQSTFIHTTFIQEAVTEQRAKRVRRPRKRTKFALQDGTSAGLMKTPTISGQASAWHLQEPAPDTNEIHRPISDASIQGQIQSTDNACLSFQSTACDFHTMSEDPASVSNNTSSSGSNRQTQPNPHQVPSSIQHHTRHEPLVQSTLTSYCRPNAPVSYTGATTHDVPIPLGTDLAQENEQHWSNALVQVGMSHRQHSDCVPFDETDWQSNNNDDTRLNLGNRTERTNTEYNDQTHSGQAYATRNLDLDWSIMFTDIASMDPSQGLAYMSANLDYGWTQSQG
ncbi:hypothetical protein BO94DRAFT_542834 [Aspergillus sclerotioniger CBS 115572]|uniref:Uncharacterized protein n=1 Tax=Aspergillus sclerotioniger CBS 115572 TaxID=1450535 RepID=A0A317X8E4_9EURO|nr:hypothetical protein BO94DRAFT_542834 [Aspergillus sclerotioniger CBS 115572]PWY94545.1 hypothetical protein BO94DRAFT_542834 [Aspergillus sclerotioniger CBS 115572]